MTNEQQRIAIVEFCGWKWVKWKSVNKRILVSPEHPIGLVQGQTLLLCNDMSVPMEDSAYHQGPIPDYPNDLNAMHEAEKKLDNHQMIDYLQEIQCVIVGISKVEPNKAYLESMLPVSKLSVISSASQRSEALLRTIGKWVE